MTARGATYTVTNNTGTIGTAAGFTSRYAATRHAVGSASTYQSKLANAEPEVLPATGQQWPRPTMRK